MSIVPPKNNRDLNQGILHIWSKFGDSSLNGWWVIARTSSWLTDTQTHTHAGNDNTRRPKLASGKNYEFNSSPPGHNGHHFADNDCRCIFMNENCAFWLKFHWQLFLEIQFHRPRLVIRTFHRQGRCSRGGHLCNEHSEEKYSCSYK